MVQIKEVSITLPNVMVGDAVNLKIMVAIPIDTKEMASAISNRLLEMTDFNSKVRAMTLEYLESVLKIERARDSRPKVFKPILESQEE